MLPPMREKAAATKEDPGLKSHYKVVLLVAVRCPLTLYLFA